MEISILFQVYLLTFLNFWSFISNLYFQRRNMKQLKFKLLHTHDFVTRKNDSFARR